MDYVKRKPNRLKNYDYSKKGAYFITICTTDKKCLLSKIIRNNDLLSQPIIKLSTYGEVVEKHIKLIPGIMNYVIMPNHVHLIIVKDDSTVSTVSQDIKSFKTIVSKKIGFSLWQRNFYDHVIRDDDDFKTKYEYIDCNPVRWTEDRFYITE